MHFGGLGYFDRAYKRHEKHKKHVSSCAKLSCLGRVRARNAINEGIHIQVAKHNKNSQKNRAFLNCLIDVTSLLGHEELAFRRHDESSEPANKGNYIEFTETIAKYDCLGHTFSDCLFWYVPLLHGRWMISCHAQLSVIGRYVDSASKIQEYFTGLLDVSGDVSRSSVCV